ncbi:Retrovirus-related Pol polyprotein from transposon RE1 [Linum grandiflorum]
MKYFLGVEVTQSSSGIFIGQQKCTKKIPWRFHLLECNPVKNTIVPGVKLSKARDGFLVNATEYKQLIGSLLYVTATIHDMMHSVCLLSRYMDAPTRQYMFAAKRILIYMKGTMSYGIFYQKFDDEDHFMGYIDSDYVGDIDDRKSTSGYVFFLARRAIS